MTKNRLEYDRIIFTPTSANIRTWPKNDTHEDYLLIFWSNSQLKVGSLSDFNLLFLIRSYSPVIVHRCGTFLVMFQWLMFVGVIFLVMYKFFGNIHLVILNRSNEYSSFLFVKIIFIFYLSRLFLFFICQDWRESKPEVVPIISGLVARFLLS